MIHWAVKYIGMKYSLGARGPDVVDCWGLLWLVYKQEFHIDLPQYPGIAMCNMLVVNSTLMNAVKSEWIQIEKPFDGAAVGMSQQAAMHHVGVYTTADGGKVLHGWERRNVVADTVKNLRLKGFRTITFFRHLKWPTS